MSCNPVIQSPEDQFLHWHQGMERKKEEPLRKMKELQSRVERSQRDNDELRTQIGKTANLEDVLLIKLPLKHTLSIFAIAHLQSPDGTI